MSLDRYGHCNLGHELAVPCHCEEPLGRACDNVATSGRLSRYRSGSEPKQHPHSSQGMLTGRFMLPRQYHASRIFSRWQKQSLWLRLTHMRLWKQGVSRVMSLVDSEKSNWKRRDQQMTRQRRLGIQRSPKRSERPEPERLRHILRGRGEWRKEGSVRGDCDRFTFEREKKVSWSEMSLCSFFFVARASADLHS